jgi:hypothetical protein
MIASWLVKTVGPALVHLALRQAHGWKREFLSVLPRPRETQDALLRRILADQRDTRFGRERHFRSVQSVAEFRRHVPVLTYEDHEPYLKEVRQGRFDALLSAKKLHMFAMTSGTTADRKYIPVTPQYLADYRRGMTIWGVDLFDQHVELRLKPILQLASDWCEFRTEAGVPCGSVSGLTTEMQKRVVRWMYCVPPAAAKIKESQAKMYVALRLALPRANLGMIASANPSTLVRLAQLADEWKEDLIRDVHDGTLSGKVSLAPEARATLSRGLRPLPTRAKELEAAVQRSGTLYPKDAWPNLVALGNWTGGSVGLYVQSFPKYYGTRPVIRDLGLIASEGRMTIPLRNGTPSGVLDITSHFFEFIPEEEIDATNPIVLQAHELEEGRHYYILLTTAYGLYRYNIFDVVRVVGFHERTPELEFLNKGAHFANLTGEKLSEFQVAAAMARVTREHQLHLAGYALSPCFEETQPYYGLFVEADDLPAAGSADAVATAVDRYLRVSNIEYDAKRESGRLGPVRPLLLPRGSWADWDRRRLERAGGSAEQYKRPCLIADPAFRNQMPVAKDPATRGAL